MPNKKRSMLTPLEDNFCKLWATGRFTDASEAAREAGYNAEAREMAYRLLKRPRVIEKIETYRESNVKALAKVTAKEFVLDRNALVERLWTIANMPETDPNKCMPVVKAIELIGKFNGYIEPEGVHVVQQNAVVDDGIYRAKWMKQ